MEETVCKCNSKDLSTDSVIIYELAIIIFLLALIVLKFDDNLSTKNEENKEIKPE